jgi:hypothetical protein
MSKKRSHSDKMATKRSPRRATSDAEPQEETSVEAITVAWVASVTAVLLADLVTVVANLFARSHPESKVAAPFEAVMLLTACVLGAISLVMLPVVWRLSRLKPPTGFVVFAALVAAAPVAATIARLAIQ